MVLGICGSLVAWPWWRPWPVMVEGPVSSPRTSLRTFAEPAIVFILLELRELEEFGVCSVPEGLSATSCKVRSYI